MEHIQKKKRRQSSNYLFGDKKKMAVGIRKTIPTKNIHKKLKIKIPTKKPLITDFEAIKVLGIGAFGKVI